MFISLLPCLFNSFLTAMEINNDKLFETPIKVVFKFKNQTGRHHRLSEQPSRIASTTIQEHTPSTTRELCTKKFYFSPQTISCKFIFADKEFPILKTIGDVIAKIENINNHYKMIAQLRLYPETILLKEIEDIQAGELVEILVIFNSGHAEPEIMLVRTDELFRAVQTLDIATIEKLSTTPLHISEKNGETVLQKAIKMFADEEDKEFPDGAKLDKIIDMIRTLIILDKKLVDTQAVTLAVQSPQLFNRLKTYFSSEQS